MSEKWTVGEPGGPAGPFYSVVKSNGNIVAMMIPDKATAQMIASLPQLTELRYEWAEIINSLALMVMDGADSNDRDQAEEYQQMVIPYLGLADE